MCIHHMVFELCVAEKKEWKMNELEIFMFGFGHLVKG